MKNLPLLIGSLVLTLLAVVGVAVAFSAKSNAPVKAIEASVLLSDTPHTKGSKEAKVTVVEFSDFQCPACGAVQPLVDELLKKNGDKILFVYRHFPLQSVHPNAVPAVLAAEAASVQGAFWQFHDKLFASQADWSGEKDPTSKFTEYARGLGLNVEQFSRDLKDTSLEARLSADERDGNIIGINATPTFFVNGLKTDVNLLTEAVDSALAGK